MAEKGNEGNEGNEESMTRERITPEIAEQMLGHNIHNRNMRDDFVYKLAEAMLRGEWRVNGESIKFDWFGNILDGQHRLAACILSEVSITTYVVRGLEPPAQDTIDIGLIRRNHDQLSLNGYVSTRNLAACLRWIYLLRGDLMKSSRSYRNSLTPDQCKQMLADEPAIPEDLKFTNILKDHVPFPQPLAGAMYHEFTMRGQGDANDFFLRFANGDNLPTGHPVLILRNKMFREYGRTPRLPSNYFGAFMVKAWNAYRDGRTIGRIEWHPSGEKNEPFPEIK